MLLVEWIGESRLLRQLQALKGGGEIVVTAGLIYGLTWQSRRSLEASMERLQRTQEELTVLHRVFRHNLRNDLNVIRGRTELAHAHTTDPRLEDNLETVVDRADTIIEQSKHARVIQRVSTDSVEQAPIELTSLVTDAVAAIRTHSEAVDVTTTLPESTWVEANPQLDEAVFEVLLNAVKHADVDPPAIHVTLDVTGDDWVTLAVEDAGPGIPEIERDALRHPGESDVAHGTGLGLWMVSWIVRQSGGDLTITDREPRGSRVSMRLPRTTPPAR